MTPLLGDLLGLGLLAFGLLGLGLLAFGLLGLGLLAFGLLGLGIAAHFSVKRKSSLRRGRLVSLPARRQS